MSACMARFRSSSRASSIRLSLNMRAITMATLPRLSKTIETANDAPEMSAAIPTGFCGSQSSPYQKATTEQIIKAETNRPQNAPPYRVDIFADGGSYRTSNGSKPFDRFSPLLVYYKAVTGLLELSVARKLDDRGLIRCLSKRFYPPILSDERTDNRARTITLIASQF